MITKLGAIMLFTPAFVVPGIISAAMGLFAGNVYLKAQLSVKREMRQVIHLLVELHVDVRRVPQQCAFAAPFTLQCCDSWAR